MGTFKVIAGHKSASENDERAFTQLYMQSYSIVYNYVYRRMGGDSAAEDVVSEAFLLAARSFYRFDPSRAKFSTWVIQIAINCMASHYRREREQVSLDDVPESFASYEDTVDDFENQELCDRLLALLDNDERTLVLMKYADGKRNVDIAAELGMNASTVSTVLSRALAKMRAAAEEYEW